MITYFPELTFFINKLIFYFTFIVPDETHLTLSIQDEDYKVVEHKKVEMVQWVVQVSAYPKATLEW